MQASKRVCRTERNAVAIEWDQASLAGVITVCRSWQKILALPHVPLLLTDFLLDGRDKKVEDANKAGLTHILRLLLKRCDLPGTPEMCRQLRFLLGVTDAAIQGNIGSLEVWLAYFPKADNVFIKKVYEIAIRKGHVHLLEWLRARKALDQNESTKALITSFSYSRPTVVYWLHSHFPALRLSISIENVAKRSSEEGSLAFLEWLWSRKNNYHIDSRSSAQTIAATRGDLRMLTWLFDHRVGQLRECTLEAAAHYGHFEVVKWIYERRHTTMDLPSSAYFILSNGHFDIFLWLFDRIDSFACKRQHFRRLTWARVAIEQAANQGHLETLKRALSVVRKPMDKQLFFSVCHRGHVHVLQWMLVQHKYFDVCNKMLDSAVMGGHLAMVQFLHGKKLNGTFKAMDAAASQGHFEILKWLHSHRNAGCSFQAMDRAACSGRLDIVQWLHVNRREGCSPRAMDAAVRQSNIAMVLWLFENRPETTTSISVAAMEAAVVKADLPFLELLHTLFAPDWSQEAMVMAAYTGRLEIVQWVHAKCSRVNYGAAIEAAINSGHLAIVQWFYAIGGAEWDPNCLAQAVHCGREAIADWLLKAFGHLDAFILQRPYAGYRCVSDYMLEWLMRHFPDEADVAKEIQDRIDHCIQTTENPKLNPMPLDADFLA